jgi:predicted phosphoadenosine phosphosulfate sulfurtransferase
MSFSVSNFNKPSNKKWKGVADFFLYSLPLYLGSIMALPITDELKLWLNFGVTILTVTIKGITKFTTDEVVDEPANG